MTGQLVDPRPAYASADVSLGMGGSALRAMAFGVPVVVQGEEGFWEILRPSSAQFFLYNGWYGIGAGHECGAARLRAQLEPLIVQEQARREFGEFARTLVRDNFSLDRAAGLLEVEYLRLASRTPAPSVAASSRAAALWAKYSVSRRWARIRGNDRADDFNTHPVAGYWGDSQGPSAPCGQES